MTYLDHVSVLIVDDIPELSEMIAESLRLKGYTVRCASDAMTALALVKEAQPHCVLLDVLMPGMNGLEIARLLRARYGDDIVLIAMSGHRSDDPAVAETFEIVDHYLRKPFELSELDPILPDMKV